MDPARARTPRWHLPPPERRWLRSTGAIAGALTAVGVAVLLPGLGFLAIFAVFASWMRSTTDWSDAALPLAMVALGALCVAAGWWVSVRRLQHWDPRARRRLTARAAVLTAVGGLLADGLLFGVFLLLERAGIAPTELALVPVAGLVGTGAGALIGSAVWPWQARRMRLA